jgi:hypothetical protein
MDTMEDKIGTILQNPEMMQKIMAMAQSLSASNASQEVPQEKPVTPNIPDIDMGMLQKMSGLAKQGNIDKQQQALLRALHPYLSSQRIQKLENAMRAAKMAKIAASMLGAQGIHLPIAR